MASPLLRQSLALPVSTLVLSGAVMAQQVDDSYNQKIREYTTDPRFLPPSVLNLTGYPTIPSPHKYFRQIMAHHDITTLNSRLLLKNFYQKGLNSIRKGTVEAPRAYVIPAGQRDLLMAAYLVSQLRVRKPDSPVLYGFPETFPIVKGIAPLLQTDKNILVSKEYARTPAGQMQITGQAARSQVTTGDTVSVGYTAYLSTADKTGMMVALTQALGPLMGSGVATQGLGFMYAQTLSGSDLASMKGGERVSSHISPVLLTKGGKPFMALGTEP